MPERPIVVTPEYLQDFGRQIHDELNRQSAFINLLTASQQREWRQLRARWVKWYSDADWYWAATNATLEGYADQVTAWSARLVEAGAPAPVAPPVAPEPWTLSSPLVWAGVALAALWLLKK
jgi:hypothetical protein